MEKKNIFKTLALASAAYVVLCLVKRKYISQAPQRKQTGCCSTITLPPADDFHLHLRDGAVTEDIILAVATRFKRAIVMPNLRPPVVSTEQALKYRERIMAALEKAGASGTFTPLMTLYLTDKTPPSEILKARESGKVFAVKLYPAGATTNSDSGVTNIENVYPTLRAMAELGMPLLVHGEVTTATVDLFDREREFIKVHLRPLVRAIPELKVVMEHITTQEAVEFVLSCGSNVAATITAHHLLYNRNAIFKGGVCPHYYCLPVLKRERHRRALVAAATSGNPKFFAGTDSAPHAKGRKEASCGCAGCYTSFAALELYAEAFDDAGAMDQLADFCCRNGANFYQIPLNQGEGLTLQRREWTVPDVLPLGGDEVVPLRAGEAMQWMMV